MKLTAFPIVLLLMSKLSLSYASNEDILYQVFQHAWQSIEEMDEEKVFLNSNKMHLNQGKIYLDGNAGETIALPVIFSDGSRLYIPRGSSGKSRPIWICRNCSWSFNYPPSSCEHCGNSEFLVRYR